MSDWIDEKWLCSQLGFTSERLRAIRSQHLKKNIDFQVKKNRVEISSAGEKKIRELLSLPPRGAEAVQSFGSMDAPNSKKTAERPSVDGFVELLVWRATLPNRRIVEAYKEGTDPTKRGNVLRVRVRDAGRFSRFDNTGAPMRIQTRHLQADLYEHAGTQPKRKGRY